jgi:hypothetical protein
MKRHTRTFGRSRPWLAGLALAACGSVVALTGGPAGAAPESVNGFFRIQSETGAACDSPVGVCLAGDVSGRIKGAFSFAATSVLTTDDTPTTAAIVTTGDAAVATEEGDILCKLTGTLQLTGDGPFVSLCVITGGTGRWAGATGYLRTSGTFTFSAGGSGTYDGKVVGP